MPSPKKKVAPKKRSPRKTASPPEPETPVGLLASLSRAEKGAVGIIALITCASMILDTVGSWRDVSVNDKRHDETLLAHDETFKEQAENLLDVETLHDKDVEDLEDKDDELSQRIMTMQTNMDIQTAELNNMRVAAERTTVALEAINEKLTGMVVKQAQMDARMANIDGMGGP